MLKIGIIIGSTRPNRIGAGVAQWVHAQAQKHTEAEFELVDIKDFNLPLLDEPAPAAMSSEYQKEHTKRWSSKIDSFDAFIFVTPEYNHGPSAALKNAIDFLYQEWNNKVAAFVGYGSVGGARVVETLRIIMAELQVATIRSQLILTLRDDFEEYTKFKPRGFHAKQLDTLIEQLLPWAQALRSVRTGQIQLNQPAPGEEPRESPPMH